METKRAPEVAEEENTRTPAMADRIRHGYNKHYITFAELMAEFDKTATLWFDRFGKADGHSEWFTTQIREG